MSKMIDALPDHDNDMTDNEWALRTSMVRLTDNNGQPYVDMAEPAPASVVLTHDEWGTAWQRHFADGLWHSTRGGRPRPWSWLMSHRNVSLAYDATIRDDS